MIISPGLLITGRKNKKENNQRKNIIEKSSKVVVKIESTQLLVSTPYSWCYHTLPLVKTLSWSLLSFLLKEKCDVDFLPPLYGLYSTLLMHFLTCYTHCLFHWFTIPIPQYNKIPCTQNILMYWVLLPCSPCSP